MNPVRTTSLLLALALGITPSWGAADAPVLTTIHVGTTNNSDSSLEPVYAKAGGLFKRSGLDARVESFSSGGAILDAVVAGALDVGFTNIASAGAALARGLPIVLLAPSMLYTSKSPINFLVAARGSTLKTGADFAGKTIGVSTLTGELQIGASAWIDRAGGDAKSVHFVEIPFAAMVPALKQGRIDAAVLSEPAFTENKDDIEYIGDASAGSGSRFLVAGFVSSKAWVAANPETARRFVTAMLLTARWANTHRAETGRILAEERKTDPAIVAVMNRATFGDALTAAIVQPLLDAAYKYGTLKQPVKGADLIADAAPFWTQGIR